MEPVQPSGIARRRIELRLHRPPLTWFARPTVTVDGVGQPAQWGTGTWAVPDSGAVRIGVYCYNRAWRFGDASLTVTAEDTVVEYRPGMLPFGPGRLSATTD